tara:strand:+ start:1838 stop:2569 length:732 start_codon:yes stop_codon:yes gene_type:complete
MSDCGCGCGSSTGTGCTDNLNSNTKNAQVSGNIKYDGANLSCASDSSIDIVNGEGINSVLQKILTKLCNTTNPSASLVWSVNGAGHNLSVVETGMTSDNAFDLAPSSGTPLYKNSGARIKFNVKTDGSVLDANGLMQLKIFGYNGTATTNFDLLSKTLTAALSPTSYSITFEFYRDSTTVSSNKIFGFWKFESNDNSVYDALFNFEYTLPFDLDTNKIGFRFITGSYNVNDYLYTQMSVEHLK